MTTFVQRHREGLEIDRRWFAVFLVLQGVLLAGSLLVSEVVLYLAAAGIAVGLFAVMILLYPWLIVPLVVVSTGLDSTGRLMKEGTSSVYHLTGFHLAFILMLFALAANTCLRRRVHFPVFNLKEPVFLLLATIAISLSYSPNQPEATVSFVRVSFLVLFMYLTQVVIDSKKAVAAVLWSMAIVTVGGAVMGAYQVITGQFHLPVKVIQALGGNVPRATGMFHNPNIFATFLMCGVLPLLAVLLNYRMHIAKRAFFTLSVLIGLGGLLASFSRSTWVATMIGIMVTLWLSKQLRYLFLFAIIGFIAILGLKEFVPFADYIFERFLSIFTFFDEFGQVGRASSTARVYLVIASIDMFLDHPVLGIGWRAFPEVFSQYAPSGFPHWSKVNEPHTVITMVLGELGIVGFVAIVWFIGRVFRTGLSGLKRMQDSYLRAVMIGMIGTFSAFQVSQTFNGDFSNNMFWFFTGMLFAVLRLDEEAREV